MKRQIVVSGSFDDLKSSQVRLLQEAARLGSVNVLLWSDELVRVLEGHTPKFPLEERQYLLQAIRYVDQVRVTDDLENEDSLPAIDTLRPEGWVVDDAHNTPAKRSYCQQHGLAYVAFGPHDLNGFPHRRYDVYEHPSGRKKIVVTGCYDWFHSGHVRFFEEVSQLGDLFVVVGHDENVRLLKGEGHPLFSHQERRYMVQAVRYVKAAFISSGEGWMDAEPEIARLKPDIYAVNEDGDRPEKRQFCQEYGLEYVVMKRLPKEGLPRRQSTNLRGF